MKNLKLPNWSEAITISGWLILAAGQMSVYRAVKMDPDPRVLTQHPINGWSVVQEGTTNLWIVYRKQLVPPTNGVVYASWDKEAKP